MEDEKQRATAKAAEKRQSQEKPIDPAIQAELQAQEERNNV